MRLEDYQSVQNDGSDGLLRTYVLKRGKQGSAFNDRIFLPNCMAEEGGGRGRKKKVRV